MHALPTTEQAPYLLFSLRGTLYGVPAASVLETVWLPELTPMAGAPPDMAGLVNVRGRVVPVTDLALRLGLPGRPYRLSDSVVLLEGDEAVTGILVEEVREVRVLPAGSIEAAPAYNGGGGAAEARFIRGVATVDEDIVALLDLDALVKAVGRTPALPAEGEIAVAPVRHGFSPGASPEEREIFRSRAQQLRQTTESFDIVGLLPVAVVSLGGEYYGLDLELIREFTRVGEITPVPCCPAHIVGNLNLRGEVLTLIDIRGVLSVPTEGVPACECAVVVEVDDLSVGVLVDEVFDVAYLRPGEITAVPTALKAAGDEYLTGTARRGDRTLGILDLRALLGREDLIVDEEV